MTLSVFICENDRIQREFLEVTVTEYISHEDYEIELVISTGSPTTFLNCWEANPRRNCLYLLDIELQHELCGISLAKKIRERDILGTIVFVTTHPELWHLTFHNRIEAMDFIIKGDNKDVAKKIHECIDLSYSRCQTLALGTEYFHVKSSSGIQRIPIDDIMFFESCPTPHKLTLHTRYELIEFRGRLKDMQHINPDFVRCHKAYVVNTKNINRVQRMGRSGEAEMMNGAIAQVADSKVAMLMNLIAAHAAPGAARFDSYTKRAKVDTL